VRAVSGQNGSAPAGPVTVTTAPVAPDTLQVSASSQTVIHLTWNDRSRTEQGFIISRSADGGASWADVASTPANATTYDDTNLPPSAARLYRVRAHNSGGQSASAGPAGATTLPALASLTPPSGR